MKVELIMKLASETGSYLCTDNICVSDRYIDFKKIETGLNK